MKRSDAIQSKTAIIKTAIRLFRNQGLEVSLTEITKQAGVSRMTFYRHFPDKKAIITAIFHYNLDRLAIYSKRLEKDNQAFLKLLYLLLKKRVEYNLFVSYMDEKQGIPTSDKLFKLFENPIEKAKSAGLLREDFNGRSDLLLLIMMVGGAASHYNVPGCDHTTERTIQLIMEGIIKK
ncbi:TetR/AcrR family transcriptional regulator [Chryseobacterium sp. G0186]|uniref:TetR/AcrR family transcriptional regulator n=1 Tax=Chryseobacterium sp. G0186 TaxID=2487064 RepID=UPI000F4DC794|nr:TetR/AcrR family transcriptional regulator [Chryseobacterium sp. G0186]AZA76059.1 TetR/AcrR family transcriptional regulator [Chryseobacterium sp. G0186]